MIKKSPKITSCRHQASPVYITETKSITTVQGEFRTNNNAKGHKKTVKDVSKYEDNSGDNCLSQYLNPAPQIKDVGGNRTGKRLQKIVGSHMCIRNNTVVSRVRF